MALIIPLLRANRTIRLYSPRCKEESRFTMVHGARKEFALELTRAILSSR